MEAVAVRYPEVRQEIDNIQHTCEVLANQLPVTPRPALKQEVMSRLFATRSDGAVVSDPVVVTGSPEAAPPLPSNPTSADGPGAGISSANLKESRVAPISSSRSIRPFQWGIAASLLIAMASAVAAFYFWNQWKETEQELDQVVAQSQRMATQYETVRQRAQQLESDLSVIESADFLSITLAGTDVSPESSAKVYWNRTSSAVYLNPGNLPVPADDQQYQLWAIVDGQPVSAGVFDVVAGDRTSLQAMNEAIANAAAFAITLEPRGGSESPTLDAMYVQGTVADS